MSDSYTPTVRYTYYAPYWTMPIRFTANLRVDNARGVVVGWGAGFPLGFLTVVQYNIDRYDALLYTGTLKAEWSVARGG